MVKPISTSIVDEVLNLANLLDKKIVDERKRRPFNMNIIDELHANENAHTRILLKLLQYSVGGEFPVLQSFLSMANSILMEDYNGAPVKTAYKKAEIIYGQDYIDGLILGEGQAVIIENKIHNAIDQNAQIERYINTVHQHGIKNERIFVIYLTRNGAKEVQDFSLTKEAKKWLDYNEKHSGRFIRMNYRDHIIKWLQDDVLPYCPFKEDLLISAIKQYIDHLEGITGIRKKDLAMNESIKHYLFEKIGVDTSEERTVWNTLTAEREKIQAVLNTVDNIRKEMSDAAYRQLIAWSTEKLNDITSTSQEWNSCIGGSFVQNLNNQWHRLIHFEWWELYPDDFAKPGFEFRFGLHLEGNYTKMRENVKIDFLDILKGIPGLQIFNEPGVKLKHGSALFEKTYYLGENSFFDTPDSIKKEFVQRVCNEYSVFIKTFDEYIKSGLLKI